jgi:dephospho-CoA kinase
VVHALYAKGGAAVAPIAALAPEAVTDGAVDRAALAARIARDPALLEKIEAIVHPLVFAAQRQFIEECRRRGAAMAVLDIPLLFETGRQADVDCVIVATAPPEVQRRRVLARPGMTEEKLRALLARQMPDAEKRRRADFLVDTSQGLDHARAQVRHIADSLLGRT